MSLRQLWISTLLLFLASLTFFYFAVLATGEYGNAGWYLLFWLFCTGLFVASSLLLSKLLKLRELATSLLLTIFILVGLYSSSPIGLMGFGLPILLLFALFAAILLIVARVKGVN